MVYVEDTIFAGKDGEELEKETDSHALAIERNLLYLKKTQDQGMYMHPDGSFMLSCYFNSDFGGLFASEDPGNPVSVISRTGYIIKFMNVPILLDSNFQTKIALSTMGAECFVLSQSMHDLIPIQEEFKEIFMKVFKKEFTPRCSTHSKAFS